MNYSGMLNVG